MKTTTALVLAGGLGTRLRPALGEGLPKCMAPVRGLPFLHYVLRYLARQGIGEAVLCLGHLQEQIMDWCKAHVQDIALRYVTEDHPLGTGGAVMAALSTIDQQQVFILNGDTYFDVDLAAMENGEGKRDLTVALRRLRDFDRYGTVELDQASRITAFREKQPMAEGWINGGIYLMDVEAFRGLGWGETFSFEKDFMEKQVGMMRFYGFASSGYFIDIGIPEDYLRAQTELPYDRQD